MQRPQDETRFTIRSKGKVVYQGTYALDEDALKICDNADDVSKARPGAFVTAAGSGEALINVKRVKR